MQQALDKKTTEAIDNLMNIDFSGLTDEEKTLNILKAVDPDLLAGTGYEQKTDNKQQFLQQGINDFFEGNIEESKVQQWLNEQSIDKLRLLQANFETITGGQTGEKVEKLRRYIENSIASKNRQPPAIEGYHTPGSEGTVEN